MIDLEGLIEAYLDCRKNKRSTASAVMYELDYGGKLIALRERVNTRNYKPGTSICFVVTRPRHREVFAASFEDRIIHHWIALRLEPLFEQKFSSRTFNCRVGKGQMYGVNMLSEDIKRCSENYTTSCWIMKLDLQGFFMSIRKRMLANMVDDFIVERYEGDDKEDLRFLCKTVIMHKPEEHCEKHSPESLWKFLPPNKSLFTNGEDLGVAIGNLFSQHFANFLLDKLDWFLLDDLGFAHVGRYVDDFYIVHQDKDRLLESVPKIRELLSSYGLRLSPTKFYLQHYTKGVEFTGSVVKLDRTYVCNRTVTNAIKAIRKLNKAETREQVEKCLCSVNSYLGFFRHNNEYNTRRRLFDMIEPSAYRWVSIKGDYKSLTLKTKCGQRAKTLKRIRDGDNTNSRVIHANA